MKSRFSIVASSLLIGLSLVSVGCGGGGGSSSSTPTIPTTTTTGSASLSGTIASSTSSVSGSSALFATAVTPTYDESASATLVVDQNGDGIYGDSKDATYTAPVATNGAFDFGTITVPEGSSYKAKLTVSKSGYAPYTKVITLNDTQNVSIVADAASAPLQVEVVTLPAAGSAARQSSFLKLGVKNSEAGVTSYAKIMSLSELNAEAADQSFGANSVSESVIPLAVFPAGVEVVNAQMKAFDPTDPDDSAKFPGEYKGVGKNSGASATEEPMQLVSVAFDLISLTDQNGDDITLDTAKLAPSKINPQAIDWSACLQTKTRYVGTAQKALIEQYGDDDNTTTEFEVPMWYYSYQTGMWQYLGEAEYDANNSKVTMCVTENWGKYLNLDYAFTTQAPKTVCVGAQYSNTLKPITDISIRAKKDTAYEYAYTNSSGQAKVALTAGGVPADYNFSYSGSVTGWSQIALDTSALPASSTTGCDYDLNISIEDPYSATLNIVAKEQNGADAKNGYVYVTNNSYDNYFYRYLSLDANGEGSISVKPNVAYAITYKAGSAAANVNGSILSPETADSGKYATVNVADVNNAPGVYVYTNSYNLSERAKTLRFTVRAYDNNGDAITMSSLKLNGTSLVKGTDYNVTYQYTSTSSDYFNAVLDLDSATVKAIAPTALAAGSYSLSATYSDDKATGSDSKTFTVAANRAPVVTSVYLKDASGIYRDIYRNIPAGTYTVYAYAYDPDGDALTMSYELDTVVASETLTLTDGAHTLVVGATDGLLSSSKTIKLDVGNRAPKVSSAGSSRYLVDINDATKNSLRLYAYASDIDGDELNVTATDGNTTYVLGKVYAGKYQSAVITPTKAGNYTYSVTANDGKKSSNTAEVKVEVIAANQAPIFTTALTSAQVNINTSKTFTCAANDPEGYEVSYKWYLGTTQQSSTTGSFSYTFSQAGSFVVSCVASDPDGESTTSSATITVINPTTSGTLTINTDHPGLIVATHNTSTLALIEQKASDANGVASFTVSGSDRATFSISRGPDFVIPQDKVVAAAMQEVAYYVGQACSNTYLQNKPTECATFDYCTASQATSVANWIVDFANAQGIIPVDSSVMDTNADGSVSSSEVYAVMLANLDKNGDGKITLSEENNTSTAIDSEFFVNVPVGTYTISFESMGSGDQYHEMMGDCTRELNYTVGGFGATDNPNISASGGISNYGYNGVNDGSGTVTYSGYLAQTQSDGNYATLFRMYDSATSEYVYYFAPDKTEAQTRAFALNKSNFSAPSYTTTTVNGYTSSETVYSSLSLLPYYKGVPFYESMTRNYSYDSVNGQITVEMANIPSMSYAINGNWSTYGSGLEMNKFHKNYYANSGIQSSYNVADYAHLNVTATLGENSIAFAGSDLTKLNSISADYMASSYDANGSYNANISFNYTVAPTSMTLPDLSSILPNGIKEHYNATPMYEYLEFYGIEIKGMSESAFISTATSTTTNWNAVELSGSRGFSIWVSMNNTTPTNQLSSMSATPSANNVKVARPFTIGYEPLKYLGK